MDQALEAIGCCYTRRMLAGKAVMINWSDVAPEHRPAYYEWHSHEHMVGRVAIPGYQRGRRYIAASAQRDFLVLYEVDELSVVTGPDYLAKANKPSPLTQRTTPFIKNSVRGLAKVRASLGIGTGGYALTLRFDPRDGGEGDLERYLIHDALPRVAGRSDITGAHLLVADRAASSVVPVERQGRPTAIPNWIVVIEGLALEAVDSACDAELSNRLLHEHGCADAVERDTYRLQLLVSRR
ncbi:MAG TPA: hypothetical protein VKF40_11030 [Burkholderiales bacterium]|nr:hypothetical protein [Burkholderiales bacterium]